MLTRRIIIWSLSIVVSLLFGVRPVWAEDQNAGPRVHSMESLDIASSQDSAVKLTYATLLFYQGQQLYIDSMDEKKLQGIFDQVEKELKSSIDLANQDADPIKRALVLSQAHYLLGDMNFYVLHDPDQAKIYYEQSLDYISDHHAAIKAIERYENIKRDQ